MKVNIVDGKIPAGESCFFSEKCWNKETVCNEMGCPVSDDKVSTKPFSCALARLAERTLGKKIHLPQKTD